MSLKWYILSIEKWYNNTNYYYLRVRLKIAYLVETENFMLKIL